VNCCTINQTKINQTRRAGGRKPPVHPPAADADGLASVHPPAADADGLASVAPPPLTRTGSPYASFVNAGPVLPEKAILNFAFISDPLTSSGVPCWIKNPVPAKLAPAALVESVLG
jgi:hypothetical protein